MPIKNYCKQCGHELECWSIGWHCSNCGCFEDMNGNVHKYKETVFAILKTNADKIRSMTDEELAEFFFEPNQEFCIKCKYLGSDCDGLYCKESMLEWLKQSAEGE